MSGWRRLGIVAAVLVCALTFVIVWNDTSIFGMTAIDLSRFNSTPAAHASDVQLLLSQRQFRECDAATLSAQWSFGQWSVTCDRTILHRLARAVAITIGVWLVLSLIGATIAWIREGFARQTKKT